jgi:RteC protein.
MENYISNLKNRIVQDIQSIEELECDNTLQKSGLIIPLLEKAFEELKLFTSKYSFKDDLEEIHFFKDIKPQLFCQLVYHNKVYNIEMRMPTGSINDRKRYLERIQNRIKYFFDMNLDFYQYYRSGNTHLDNIYFLWGKPDVQLLLDSFYYERDTDFSTCYDFKVAKILANEMLSVYINSKLSELDKSPRQNTSDVNVVLPKVKITWTGKKAELVEQIYAWIEANSFNHGNVNIKELVNYIESVFNIDLGDFYHIFLEMRARKGSRTIYLDKLIKLLNDRMDNADRNFKN